MPQTSFRFKLLIQMYGAFAAGAAHGKLHGHHGDPEDDQKQNVDQNKCASAVCSCQIRKLPHISNSDRAASADQDEAQTAS